jgi:phospholipid/cholesterol/gamma-HCH transport system substrate-binding protein
MTVKRERTVIVGAFVAGTIVILAIGLLWLAGSRFFRRVDQYHVIFAGSVSGLAAGAPVQVNGVQVGRVTDIDLTDDVPPKVDVTIDVKPGTPIRTDSKAKLSGNIVTGIRFIEVAGGTPQAPPLSEDGSLTGDQASLADLQAQASDVAQKTYDLIASLKHDTLNHDNRIALGEMIQNLAAVSKNMRAVTDRLAAPNQLNDLDNIFKNLNAASGKIDEAATRADRVMAGLETGSGRTIQNFNHTLDKMNVTLDNAQTLVSSANSILDRNTYHIDHALLQIDRISDHLDETIETIQANPSVLVWGSRISDRELEK